MRKYTEQQREANRARAKLYKANNKDKIATYQKEYMINYNKEYYCTMRKK